MLLGSQALAQLPSGVEDDGGVQFNHVKVNLTALPFNNYSLQYERVLDKKSAVAFSIRFMPESKVPFQGAIKKTVAAQSDELQTTVDRLRVSHFAITPEYRLYFGKGYGRGFYIAPFYRYAKFKSNNILITYNSDIFGKQDNINLSGELSSHTAGIAFGTQWVLGKNITLDWTVLGGHYGAGKGNFIGVSSKALTSFEQASVREELEKLDIPLTKKTIEVNAQGASMKLAGPWGGVRSSISLGINF